MKRPFLFVGPWPKKYQEMGGVLVRDLDLATLELQANTFSVVALYFTQVLTRQFSHFYSQSLTLRPHLKFVWIIPVSFDFSKAIELYQSYPFHGLLEGPEDPSAENVLRLALEKSKQTEQEAELFQMASGLSKELQSLTIELEDRVEKRTKYLTEARRKLFLTNMRNEAFKHVLTLIPEARGVEDLEDLLNKALLNVIEVAWIKICPPEREDEFQEKAEADLTYKVLKIPLYKEESVSLGALFFMRANGVRFAKDEQDFLVRVAEIVSLALGRIAKRMELESAERVWRATLGAISDPLMILDENYTVIQSNQEITGEHPRSQEARTQKKCYETLFHRDSPCSGCRRGGKFQLRGAKEYEVDSQKLQLEKDQPWVYVHFYHDVSERRRLEQKLIEHAKMAELGTIGSSIAHELNNPLGGMLSFAQLIRGDLKGKEKEDLLSDISDIEAGIQRAKDIVQNLLNFTRNTSQDEVTYVDLDEAFERAVAIVQIRARHLNVGYQIQLPLDAKMVRGSLNLLAQALKNILSLIVDVLEGLPREQRPDLIHVQGRRELEQIVVIFQYPGGEKINLDQLTEKILEDHQVRSLTTPGQVVLTFLRPVFRS